MHLQLLEAVAITRPDGVLPPFKGFRPSMIPHGIRDPSLFTWRLSLFESDVANFSLPTHYIITLSKPDTLSIL